MIEHVWVVTDEEYGNHHFVSVHRTLDGAKRSRAHAGPHTHEWAPTDEPDQYSLTCGDTEMGIHVTRWPLER